MRDEEKNVSQAAAYSLVDLSYFHGADISKAEDALIRALRRGLGVAAYPLMRIATKGAMTAIRYAAIAHDPRVRFCAREALRFMKEEAEKKRARKGKSNYRHAKAG